MQSAEQDVVINVTRISQLTSQSKVKAFVAIEVQFGDHIMGIEGFKVLEGDTGLYVKEPSVSRPGKDGKTNWFQSAFFSQSLFFAIRDAIIAAYESGEIATAKIEKPKKGNGNGFEKKTSAPPAPKASSQEEDIPF